MLSTIPLKYSVQKLGRYGERINQKVDTKYSVSTVVVSTGERLPILVERETAVPCELALRWSILDRREHVAASTLTDDLRAVQKLYEWADQVLETPLDKHLIEWKGFSAKQIYSLAQYLKTSGRFSVAGSIGTSGDVLSPGTFNSRWRKIEHFLRWAAQMYARDDSDGRGQQWAIQEARKRIERVFRQHLTREPATGFVGALKDEEWEKIRQVVDPAREDVWPDPRVRFRNFTMVYLAINTGVRIGEMLKLTLDQIPLGREEHITVKRNPDDPSDPRSEEPRVKSNERELFVPAAIRRVLGAYATQYRERSRYSYLFLTQGGEPLSLRRARHVAEQISEVAKVHLTWHRFRHTFLDRVYEKVSDEPNGKDLLREIAGWSSDLSAEPYVRLARHRKANEILARYQETLFQPPESHSGFTAAMGDHT